MGGLVLSVPDAIISVRRVYAEALLAGTKTVELRRRFPNLPVGTRLWIYITKPIGAIAGHVTIRKIKRSTPLSIWKSHKDVSGIDYRDFSSYFDGTNQAVALEVLGAERTAFVTLERLREIRENFQPPQIVARLSNTEREAIMRLSSN